MERENTIDAAIGPLADGEADAPPSPIDPADYINLVRHMVKRSARWKLKTMPRGRLDDSEEFAEGCVALVRAARKFDPSRGLQFSTFACHVISMAILEMGSYEHQGKRDKSREVFASDVIDRDGKSPIDRLADRETTDPFAVDHAKTVVRRMLRRLSPRNRSAVKMFYFDGMQQAEIGASLTPPMNQQCTSNTISRSLRKMRDFAQRNGIEP